MNGTTQTSVKTALRWGLMAAAAIYSLNGQTLINLSTQGRNVDFSNASSTRPVQTGTTLPATCSQGQLFFNTSAPAGQNFYGCSTANTWSLQGGLANGISDPGTNGLLVRTAPNTATVISAPAGAVVGTTDAQTLSNKSIDAAEINTGTLLTSRMPAFSGDVSTSAGTTTTTLATVNASTGTFGDSSHSVQLTVDAKGRVTQVSAIPIAAASGSASALVSGALASLPGTCSAGSLYFAADQPAGQQIYTCSAANTWTQSMSLGGSGALAINNGSLDIVTSVIPRLTAANTFSGFNSFSALQIAGSSTNPGCASTSDIGKIWINTTSSTNTAYQVCLAVSGTVQWVTK